MSGVVTGIILLVLGLGALTGGIILLVVYGKKYAKDPNSNEGSYSYGANGRTVGGGTAGPGIGIFFGVVICLLGLAFSIGGVAALIKSA